MRHPVCILIQPIEFRLNNSSMILDSELSLFLSQGYAHTHTLQLCVQLQQSFFCHTKTALATHHRKLVFAWLVAQPDEYHQLQLAFNKNDLLKGNILLCLVLQPPHLQMGPFLWAQKWVIISRNATLKKRSEHIWYLVFHGEWKSFPV